MVPVPRLVSKTTPWNGSDITSQMSLHPFLHTRHYTDDLKVHVVKLVSMLSLFFSCPAPATLNDWQRDTWSSMKALGSRFSFYAGFVVGTFTLYVFLRQVWFERTLSEQQTSGFEKLHDYQQQLEEERKIWKKERSALFNLKHPHHTGTGVSIAHHTQKDVHIQ